MRKCVRDINRRDVWMKGSETIADFVVIIGCSSKSIRPDAACSWVTAAKGSRWK